MSDTFVVLALSATAILFIGHLVVAYRRLRPQQLVNHERN